MGKNKSSNNKSSDNKSSDNKSSDNKSSDNKKPCLTCKVNIKANTASTNEKVIPDWMKKAGTYSLLPKQLNCMDKYNANKVDLVVEKPVISGTEVFLNVDGLSKNNWVFYWASDKSENNMEIKTPEEAYEKQQNHGLVETDNKGKTEFILNCPQPYKVDNVSYPRHIHFVELKEDKTWSDEVKTLDVYCNINKKRLKEIIQSNDHVIINSLESTKDMIDTSVSMPYVDYEGEENYKKKMILDMKKFIKKRKELNKMDILDIPIVVYCASEKCNASDKLIKMLTETGFVNICKYPGGLEEWNKDEEEEEEEEKEEEKKRKVDNTMFNLNIGDESLIIVDEKKKYDHDLITDEVKLSGDEEIIGKWNGKKIIKQEGGGGSVTRTELIKLKNILEGGNVERELKRDGIYICNGGSSDDNPGQRGWGWTFFK